MTGSVAYLLMMDESADDDYDLCRSQVAKQADISGGTH